MPPAAPVCQAQNHYQSLGLVDSAIVHATTFTGVGAGILAARFILDNMRLNGFTQIYRQKTRYVQLSKGNLVAQLALTDQMMSHSIQILGKHQGDGKHELMKAAKNNNVNHMAYHG